MLNKVLDCYVAPHITYLIRYVGPFYGIVVLYSQSYEELYSYIKLFSLR